MLFECRNAASVIMMMVGYQYCGKGKSVFLAIIENGLRVARIDDGEIFVMCDDPNVVIV